MKINSFLLSSLFLSISSFCTQAELDRGKILQQLNLDPAGKTEVVKNFPDSFPEILTERGTPLTYTKENSQNFEYIGMPIGGIGAGQLYLGGDGQLWFWDIFNLNNKINDLKNIEAYEEPYTRSNPEEAGARMLDQGFSIRVKTKKTEITKTLNRNGFEHIEFLGQYPIAEVSYNDTSIPVTIKLEAFSPFIPLDIENSVYPATILNYTVTNTSKEEVEVELNGWLENAVLAETRKEKTLTELLKLKNRTKTIGDKGLRLECLAYPVSFAQRESLKGKPDYGTMSLTVLGSPDELTASKSANATLQVTPWHKIEDKKLVGKIGRKTYLKANETKTFSFILSWHFKNSQHKMYTWWSDTYSQSYIHKDTHYYASKFKNAHAVSDHVIEHFDELTQKTRLWRETWYDSTLPYWFLDRTFLNTSILASCTARIWDGFVFYGTEGSYQGTGIVNHVWGYVQAMGRLFPSLEKSICENVSFCADEDGGAMMPDGTIRYRWMSTGLMAVDGQSGNILRAYLAHQMSKDDQFLRANYSGIKKTMMGLTQNNDSDHDGILTGPQHNTLDGTWYGKVTWLSLHYTCALRATARMAEEMGDSEYAEFCTKTADKGRSYIENNLFNEEYFFHEGDPDHPESPGIYNGNEYSQLFGQSWAYQVGMGEILDPQKTKTALESLWRYNFSTDVGPFREAHPEGRWYAMPGESGLIACTWPNGGQEVLDLGPPGFAAYNNECQNGYEYAATSLMMWHDMPYHSLAHIWYMHNDRYHGSKRNPWCEVEWGIHYARSMASYGHFVAVSGFEYHGPKGYLAFAPQITPENFKGSFTTAEGWGTFTQQRTDHYQIDRIELKYGQLSLDKIAFEIPPKTKINSVKNDSGSAFDFEISGSKIVILFKQPILLKEGQSMTFNIQ